jgi:DNA helicase-2/ATP-dependent DNA helicase PcrA
MVKEKELEEIFEIIEQGNNFLLSGGAGSGKTHTLVQVLNKLFSENPSINIVCITYTNVAVNEIRERAPYKNLRVSTIHDFLWDIISSFQTNLKEALIQLVAEDEINYSGDKELTIDDFKEIEVKYREWKKLNKGTISHDEVISLAEYMFREYELLSDIVKDSYDFIFIDEYQDTFEKVIKILLEHLEQSNKSNIVGLFGDKMQSIYGNGVGDIESYVDQGMVHEVIKKDNRRNPFEIVELINKLRSDGLEQEVVDDSTAPNYEVEGYAKFLYSNAEDFDISEIRETEYFENFNFDNYDETKELYLVKKLIADKAGFTKLMDIYTNDGIIYYKERIRKYLKNEGITIDDDKSFGEVIDEGYKGTTSKIEEFINEYPELYRKARSYPYKVIENVFLYADKLIGKKSNDEDENKRSDRVDALINHLLGIQECIYLYREKRYSDFIEKTHFDITTVEDKKALKKSIEKLVDMKEDSIEDVIDFADEAGIWEKDDNLLNFIKTKEYVYDRAKEVEFREITKLYKYVENYTPYSTQHNIKGAEFDNVFVLLDNGNWSSFNFEYLFERDGKDSVISRTEKIFYVCCSRAKKNLIVYFHQPSQKILETAQGWFGPNNVHSLQFD